VEVRALVFDLFGTLVDWRSGVADAFRAGDVPGDAEQLADEWRARLWPVLADINSDARPWQDFDEVHAATLEALLAERDCDLPAEDRRRLLAAWHRLDPWPDVRAGLDGLRRTHVTAVLSNGHMSLLIDLARRGDLRFDCLISAELMRRYKPAREVYETAVHLLGVAPAELMLVAAHPADLAGARRVGLRTAFVDRPLEYGAGSPARTDPEADESVTNLDELAARLASRDR
jgi:2-haloacid dehalogenase